MRPASPTADPLTTYSHPKASINVLVKRSAHTAGGTLQGILEVGVLSSALLIGNIDLALIELTSLDHSAVNVHLKKQVCFQDPSSPSEAVLANRNHDGFWPVRGKGRTRFNFEFELPRDLPSSCQFGRNKAAVRYQLRATVAVLWENQRALLTKKLDVTMHELFEDAGHPDLWTRPVKAEVTDRLAFGGPGSLHLEAQIGPPSIFWRSWVDEDGRVQDGRDEIEVRLAVRNTTKSAVSGVKIAILRRLDLLTVGQRPANAAPLMVESVDEQAFRDLSFAPSSERPVELAIVVPAALWTVGKTKLFTISLAVRVTLDSSSVELPVTVVHPLSIAHSLERLPAPALEYAPPPRPSPYAWQDGHFSASAQPIASPAEYFAFDPLAQSLSSTNFDAWQPPVVSPRPLPTPTPRPERVQEQRRPEPEIERPRSATYDGPTPSSALPRTAPDPPYSALERGLAASRRQSAPMPTLSIEEEAPVLIRSSSAANLSRTSPSPPIASSSKFRTPQLITSTSTPASEPEVPLTPLETIGEDGESQLGTLRTAMAKGLALEMDESMETTASRLEELVAQADLEKEKSLPALPAPAPLHAAAIFEPTEPTKEAITSHATPVPPVTPSPAPSQGLSALEHRIRSQRSLQQLVTDNKRTTAPDAAQVAVMRRDAVSKVADWLTSAEPEPAVIKSSSPMIETPTIASPSCQTPTITTPLLETLSDSKLDATPPPAPAQSSPAAPALEFPTVVDGPSPKVVLEDKTEPVLSSPGIAPSSPAVRSPPMPIFELRQPKAIRPVDEDGPKYDVHSARGGRGGRVSAAAAVWAERVFDSELPTAPKKLTVVPRKLAVEEGVLAAKLKPTASSPSDRRMDARALHDLLATTSSPSKTSAAAPFKVAATKPASPKIATSPSPPTAREDIEALQAAPAASYLNTTIAKASLAPPTVLVRRPKARSSSPLLASVARPDGGAPDHGAGHARLAALIAKFDS